MTHNELINRLSVLELEKKNIKRIAEKQNLDFTDRINELSKEIREIKKELRKHVTNNNTNSSKN